MSRAGEEFFEEGSTGRQIYRRVADQVLDWEDVSTRVGRSQVAFRTRRGFAYAWVPGQYVRSQVPVVLSFALSAPLSSARIKSVAHPARDVWMHHVELLEPTEVDDELMAWLRAAWEESREPRGGARAAHIPID